MPDYLDPRWDAGALLLVDVQNDFVDGPSAIGGTAPLLPVMAGVAQAFRAAGRPIVHVVRSYRPGESDVDAVRRAAIEAGDAAVRPGTAGAAIPGALTPVARAGAPDLDWAALRAGRLQRIGDHETVMYKPRWSAFHRTPLHEHLRHLAVDTVVVAGCNLPNCPRATLFDASALDYRAVLVSDATSQTTPERLADLELIGVRLRTAAEVVDALGRLPDVLQMGS